MIPDLRSLLAENARATMPDLSQVETIPPPPPEKHEEPAVAVPWEYDLAILHDSEQGIW